MSLSNLHAHIYTHIYTYTHTHTHCGRVQSGYDLPSDPLAQSCSAGRPLLGSRTAHTYTHGNNTQGGVQSARTPREMSRESPRSRCCCCCWPITQCWNNRAQYTRHAVLYSLLSRHGKLVVLKTLHGGLVGCSLLSLSHLLWHTPTRPRAAALFRESPRELHSSRCLWVII